MAHNGISDFRSDTVTWPTPAMYEAMASAPLGDDSFRDDPTVLQLEVLSAQMMGKESGLYCPSGTMANQVAGRVHCPPGKEVILDEHCHSLNFELAGLAYAGLQMRPIAGERGLMACDDVAERLRVGDSHTPGTGLLWLENTHNLSGGRVIPQENIVELSQIAHRASVPVHLDGARIFNAQVASGIPAKRLTEPVDSVMFCLSKGLCCPVGSVLCGSEDFIEQARKVRQLLGGTMRQAGIIAACGLVALRENIDRLAEDHKRAKRLAEELTDITGIELNPDEVDTNMVYFRLGEGAHLNAPQLVEEAHKEKVWFLNLGEDTIRMVCHKDIDDNDVERALQVIGSVLGKGGDGG